MLNHITIHGYCGADPELVEKQGQNGAYKQVTFSVGVGRDFGDETDWFRCSMNGKRAEVIEKYFRKGSEIIVSGRMESYKKKDGSGTGWSLRVTDFDFAGKGDNKRDAQTRNDDIPDSFEDATDDIPF